MKKTLALILTLALSLAALTGCGSKTETPADTNTDSSAQTETPAETALSGSVSTNGSTSMEKVIGALSEQFMAPVFTSVFKLVSSPAENIRSTTPTSANI